MTEIELKFQIPAERRAAVARTLLAAGATTTTLQAHYVDTPDRRLAAARMALRVRRDGRQWMQTVKAETAELHRRLEHEVAVRPPGRGRPPLADPALHAGTPVGALLQQRLGDAAATLEVVHQTRVRRTRRTVRCRRSRIEISLDVGAIRADGRTWPLHEIEFELVHGSFGDLIALAGRWVRRFGLWLDVRSKAERGERLAQGMPCGPAQRALPPTATPQDSADAALRRMVGDGLRHALPNAAEIADGRASAEQLHQLRVALRRLRTALRLFGAWSPAVDPAWSSALRVPFAALAAVRQHDALMEEIVPALRAAGAPEVDLPPPATGASPAAVVTEPAFTLLMLDLLAFSAGADAAAADTAPRWPDAAAAALAGLQHRLAQDARRFEQMDDAGRHSVRKRLKRLRYGLDFTALAWPGKRLRKLGPRLQAAQDALGALNDRQVAEELFRVTAAEDPRAWFAVGWLVARQAVLVERARRALKRLARAGPVSPAARRR